MNFRIDRKKKVTDAVIKHLTKLHEGNKLPPGEAAINRIIRDYKRNAKIRNCPFSLSREEFKFLIFQNCFYCTSSPYQIKSEKGGTILYNGIDRKDNNYEIGYTIDNCVSCCGICNRAKDTMSLEEFRKWVKIVNQTVNNASI